MKKIIAKYTGFLLALGIFAQLGCNKLLDLKPINEISDVDYWKNPEQFKLAANEFYTYLLSFAQVLYDPFGANSNGGSPHSDLRGDFAYNINVFSNGNNPLIITDGNWNTAFTRLRAINYLLDKSTTYANPAEIAQYVAEAKFFRAYVYFDLLQQYGAAPILEKPLDISSPELNAARNSRDEVVDFIIKDLEEAIAVLNPEAALGAANKGRISKGAAQAFLGRVSLYEGSWQKFRSGNAARYNALFDKSIAASEAVMNTPDYQLFAPAVLGDSALKYLFILEDEKSNPAGLNKSANKEYILSNRYSFTQRQVRQNVTHTWLGYGLTKKFADLFLCEDGLPVDKSPLFQGYASTRSEYLQRDHRMQYMMMIDSNYYWDNENPGSRVSWNGDAVDIAGSRGLNNNAVASGYRNQKWATERRLNDNEEGYDWPVIRLAEVYLNYAEAVFERHAAISDAELDRSLNLVRRRVNKTMPGLSNALVAANGLDMRSEIRRERNIELFLEGFHVDDLKRWKTAETEMPMNLLGVKWKGSRWETRWLVNGNPPFPVDANGNLILETGRKWTDKNYLLPVPTQQIQLNPQLGPNNPGWQ
jgi:hypothetical protein